VSSVFTASQLDEYWSERELAKELRRNPRTVARWRQQRIAPPHTWNGREVVYAVRDVREWLNAGGTRARLKERDD
jgi:hypothetical protein